MILRNFWRIIFAEIWLILDFLDIKSKVFENQPELGE